MDNIVDYRLKRPFGCPIHKYSAVPGFGPLTCPMCEPKNESRLRASLILIRQLNQNRALSRYLIYSMWINHLR